MSFPDSLPSHFNPDNNMENKPTAADALRVLDQATQPQNVCRLNRLDLINIQTALQILAEFVDANTPKVDAAIPDAPKKRGPKPKTEGAFGAPVKP